MEKSYYAGRSSCARLAALGNGRTSRMLQTLIGRMSLTLREHVMERERVIEFD